MKIIKNVFRGLVLALAFTASASFAASDSFVSGGIAAGASVINGTGGFHAGYQGGAGTMSWTGATHVQAGGGVSGEVSAHKGQVSGIAQSGATGHQFGNSASTMSGSMSAANASVKHGGVAHSGAVAGSGASASSSLWY